MHYEPTTENPDESIYHNSKLNDSLADTSRLKRKRTIEDYEFVLNETSKFKTSELGKGSYGVVKKVKSKLNGKIYAMKIMSKRAIFQYSNKDNLKREINIQKAVDHPHIVKLHGHFEDTENVYLVLEYAEHGSLFHYIRNKKKFTENEAFVYFFQTCLGIDYLHKRDIIHRDLKPENLLLNGQGDIKICDFGWSTDISNKRHTFCGTVDYMAPEMIKNQPHDHRIDIWSLGVLLYEMLHGFAPFKGRTDQEKTRNISMNMAIDFDPALSPEVVELVRKILQPAPVNRISMRGIFEHQWMRKAEKIYDIDVMWYVRNQDEQIRQVRRAESSKSTSTNNITHQNSFVDVTDRSIDRSMDRSVDRTIDRSYSLLDRNVLDRSHSVNPVRQPNYGPNASKFGGSTGNAKIITVQDNSSPLSFVPKLSYEEPKKQHSLYNNNRSTKASESSSIGSGNGSNTLTIEQLLREHGIRQEKPVMSREDLLGNKRYNFESGTSKSQQFPSGFNNERSLSHNNIYPTRPAHYGTEPDRPDVTYSGQFNFSKTMRDVPDTYITSPTYGQKQKSVQYDSHHVRDMYSSSDSRSGRPQYQQGATYRDRRVDARPPSIDKMSISETYEDKYKYRKFYDNKPAIDEEREDYEDFKRMSRVSHRNVEIFKKKPAPKERKDVGFFERLLTGIGCITRDANKKNGEVKRK